MSGWEIKTPTGQTLMNYVQGIINAVEVTEEDLLYAGERFKADMLERTAKGIDVNGKPFAPYSTKGPYYFYPGDRGSRPSTQFMGNKAAGLGMSKSAIKGAIAREIKSRDRFYRKIGLKGQYSTFNLGGMGTGEGSAGKTFAAGIKFSSYAAFKASLGRSNVDLMGPFAPHMLQKIVVSSRSMVLIVGIYDDESAAIAKGHNEGAGNLPQRRFFDVSSSDVGMMQQAVLDRIAARIERMK